MLELLEELEVFDPLEVLAAGAEAGALVAGAALDEPESELPDPARESVR